MEPVKYELEETKQEPPKDWQREVISLLKSKLAKKIGLILVGLVLLRFTANWWLERNTRSPIRNVKVAELALKNMDKTLGLPGNIEAIEQATLYAHVSGYLKKILVDEGDKVTKNQLIAVIDAPDIIQEFRNAKAEYDFKETTRKRYEELLKEQVVSQQEYDKVNAEANEAKARFDNADANLGYTEMHAPFAGSIARRYKYPGDFISAPTKGGQPSPLFLLVNEDRLRIAINAPQNEVGNVGVGHSVDIHVDTFPGKTFTGLVSRVDALLDEATKTQRVLIDIDNPDTKLRAGMFASVVLHIERKDNIMMITKDAVHEDGDKTYVFTVRDGKAKKIPVTLGDTESGSVEIISHAIIPGERIVIEGGAGLLDGDRVKVINESGLIAPAGKNLNVPTELAEETKKPTGAPSEK